MNQKADQGDRGQWVRGRRVSKARVCFREDPVFHPQKVSLLIGTENAFAYFKVETINNNISVFSLADQSKVWIVLHGSPWAIKQTKWKEAGNGIVCWLLLTPYVPLRQTIIDLFLFSLKKSRLKICPPWHGGTGMRAEGCLLLIYSWLSRGRMSVSKINEIRPLKIIGSLMSPTRKSLM